MSDGEQRLSGWQRWTMVAVILGSATVFLDTSVVNLALPRIAEELPRGGLAALEAQSYVRDGYFLTLSALLILAGALTDFFGRRKMFTVGLVGFLITSVLCGLAPSMSTLIAFRLLQGAAGALVVPGSLAIITASFRGEQQGRAFGLWAGASAGTSILGPFVGGVLVDTISWRAAFFINIPMLLVALSAMRKVPETRDETASGRFDWLGSLVVIVAVGGLAFGTVRGQQSLWSDTAAFVALGLGALAAAVFPFMMTRRRNPLVRPSLFRSRNFTVTNVSTFLIYGALYISLSFQGLFLIGTLGYNAPAAGIAGLPAVVFLTFFSSKFGRLAARYGPRLFMAAGPFIMALGLLYLVRFPADSEPWILGTGPGQSLLPPASYAVDLLPSLIVFGIGLMIMVAPLTTALMTSVPAANSGVASAINNAISRVGAPIVGALVFVAVVASFYGAIGRHVPGVDTSSLEFRERVSPLNVEILRAEGARPDLIVAAREASTNAFHLSALVGAGLLLLGAGVNAAGIRNPRRTRRRRLRPSRNGSRRRSPRTRCRHRRRRLRTLGFTPKRADRLAEVLRPREVLDLLDWKRRVFAVYAEVRGSDDPARAWRRWRAVRDDLIRTHPQSPIADPAARARFSGARHFDYDAEYRVLAEVVTAEPERIVIPASADGAYAFTRFAEARFEVGGESHALALFWLEGYGGGLFLSFRDATSGTETYGACRYLLDTVKGADLGTEDGRLVLDFNFAYNPSCAYDPRWVCPLAPPENRLAIPVRAGERYEKAEGPADAGPSDVSST